jgi:hypothetical protein
MSTKTEYLERTILELGTDLYRLRSRMDLIEREATMYKDVLLSLKGLLDEKGLISCDEFEEAVALDRHLAKLTASANDSSFPQYDAPLKKAVN